MNDFTLYRFRDLGRCHRFSWHKSLDYTRFFYQFQYLYLNFIWILKFITIFSSYIPVKDCYVILYPAGNYLILKCPENKFFKLLRKADG